MRIHKLIIYLLFTLGLSVSTSAQAIRTFVSAQMGSDTNNCSRPAPCRTFQKGHDTVAAGGEVIALDSGGYGALNINKAVTIAGPVGQTAIITPPNSGIGINITAGDTDTVVIRGLTISGAAGGANGIMAFSRSSANAGTIQIENCVVYRFSNNGIGLTHLVQGSSTRRVSVKDTVVRNCNNGLLVSAPAGVAMTATIDHCRFEGSMTYGCTVGGIKAVVSESVSSYALTSDGFFVSDVGGDATFYNCVSSHNGGDGFHADSGGTARVAYSTAFQNSGFGFDNTGGTFISMGNNFVSGNAVGPSNGSITTSGSL